MTTNEWYDDDEALLRELRDAVPPDPLHHGRMRSAARGAFAWRTIDADLERLAIASDSLLTAGHLVRSATTVAPRRLFFESATFGMDIEIGDHSITGQILPMNSGTIELVTGTGTTYAAEVDDFGCFVVDRPADGSVSVRCTTATAAFRTDWITL